MAFPVLLYTSEHEIGSIIVWNKVVKNHSTKWGCCCKSFVCENKSHLPASHDLGDKREINVWKISF